MNDHRDQDERRSQKARRVKHKRRIQGDRREQEDRRAQGDRKGLTTYQKLSVDKKRDEMIKNHLNLVNFVVARLSIGLPGWLDKRDLINAGVIGLIDAVNHFDPSKGVKFETYASTRIRGAIIDELRSLDWIPRSTRAKSREIESVISNLINKLGHIPTDDEVAAELDWDMDKYYKVLEQVSGTTLLSLDELVATSSGGDSVKRIDTVASSGESTLEKIERRELIDNVVNILGTLSEQEKLAIALYYYEELTLKEIGMVMNVTESRVSQIHTSAILKLRAKLRSLYFGS